MEMVDSRQQIASSKAESSKAALLFLCQREKGKEKSLTYHAALLVLVEWIPAN
jgi:hypothetical protein